MAVIAFEREEAVPKSNRKRRKHRAKRAAITATGPSHDLCLGMLRLAHCVPKGKGGGKPVLRVGAGWKMQARGHDLDVLFE